jgi:hypothetical protein
MAKKGFGGRPLTAADGYSVTGVTGTDMGGFGGGMPSLTQAPGGGGGAPGLSLQAQTYPELEALQQKYNSHLDDLKNNTGHVMDVMGTKMRDAREGGKESLRQANAFAGRASTPANAAYEAQTQRGVQSTLADVANDRERQLTSALQGGLGIARAPAELALSEKGLGLQAYQAQTQAANQSAQMNLQALLALLQAQRSSPVYSGF